MKSTIVFLTLWILIGINVRAQKATITEQIINMKTYMYSDPNPVPDMSKNYPYYRYDGFTTRVLIKNGTWLLWRTNTLPCI